MKSLLVWVFPLLLLPQAVFAADPEVTLTQGKFSVKVMIGEDVFTVFHYGEDRRKSFFLPVTGPGGFELLVQAVSSEKPGSVGRKVFVASEEATLDGGAGKSAVAHYADVLEVSKVDGNRLWIEELQGWIQRADIAPLAAGVTRLINDEPESKSKKDLVTGDKYDHPHHKGIWFSVDDINEILFWMEGSIVRTESVKLENADGPSAAIHFVNHWLDKNNQPVMVETTKVTFTPDRLLTYDTVLTPAGEEVHIGDTKEGMFAIRLSGTMRELAGGGPVTTSNGVEGTKKAWGKTAHWVNYDGPVDGHIFGVTIMDSDKNPWASRYHVRDYGLFAANPFGAGAYTSGDSEPQPKHSRTLKKGESLHFKFGAWIHGPGVTKEEIQKVYDRF